LNERANRRLNSRALAGKKARDCGLRAFPRRLRISRSLPRHPFADFFVLSAGGVGCFFGGVALVLVFKRPLIGMVLEAFGFVNLFGNFFPIALSAMRTMPVIGNVLAMPGVSAAADKLAGVQQRRAQNWA